ncbi:MAG TPA: ABC transporter permease subunit [Methylomirabilota bacterium]|nr:ABC transporter permease subunit [Methylomirabilota bacterium]
MTRAAGWALLAGFAAFLLLPLAATALYAVASTWTTTVMPAGLTLDWLVRTVREPRFAETLGRSLGLGVVVIALDLLLATPALVALVVRRAAWRRVLDVAALLPYAMPGVVLALAVVRFYGAVWPPLLGTPALLALAHGALALPVVYWAILGNLRAIRLQDLYDAALMSGARWPQTLRHVVLPNVATGLGVAAVAAFAASFTDFAVANLVVGAAWPTFSVWQGSLIRANAHLMAVTSVVSLVVTLGTTLALLRLAGGGAPGLGHGRG